MKRSRGMWLMLGVLVLAWILGPAIGCADWMWTPESGKWISEKNIEKKSAMLLFEEAENYEESGDYAKAIATHRKLIRQYPASSVAPDAQYRVGQLLEAQGDYYKAFREYQKVIENYPSYKRFNEILEREYQIGNLYLSGEKLKVLGVALLPAVDKSIAIFEAIVRTAPYSSIAPRAQFNIGEAYRKIRRYADAIPEYQKVIDNYPESDLAKEAGYQIGQCGYQKTLKASYDQTNTDIALDSMKGFLKKNADSKKSVEIEQRIKELTNRKAKKTFDIAEFYNRSNAEEAAIIYYQDVIVNFPNTEYAKTASQKIDELIARPTKKKYADAKSEELEQAGKKNFLAGLWPFGRKPQVATEEIPGVQAATEVEVEEVTEEAQAKKPGFLEGLWPFGKKERVAVAAAGTAAAKKKAGGGKPFWAFWAKEQKKQPTQLALDEEISTPSRAAGQMKLPGQEETVVPQTPTEFAGEPMEPAPTALLPQDVAQTSQTGEAAGQVTQEIAKPAEAVPAPAVVQPPVVQPPAVLQVKSFATEQEGSTLRLLFETNGDLPFKTFYLKDPSRILISFSKSVYSNLQETIAVNKLGVLAVRHHFRSKEAQSTDGRPLNAIVVDLEKSGEAKVYNDLDTFIIEVQKG